jgi:hypothetical protein
VANRPGPWVALFRISFLVAIATCLACEGRGAPERQAPGETVASRLTAGRTAADEQARASTYAESAARYRQLADENKQAVADPTAVPVRAKRQAAAALADRLAAAAQKVAAFHTQRAAEKAALAGEVRQ